MTWLAVPLVLQVVAQIDPAAAVPTPHRPGLVYWFLPPLVLAISVVYSASRHEQWSRIAWGSLRLCGAIFGILLATTVVLLLINTQV